MRTLSLFATSSWLLALGTLGLCDCGQQPVTVPVRSLERSGKLALLCLDAPALPSPNATASPATPGRDMSECVSGNVDAADFSIRHVYALVTQTTRGEAAVVDLTGQTVIDVDRSSPGFNFLPVGAEPVDIVATPAATAAFVASAQANQPGVYALPSTEIRGDSLLPSDAPRHVPTLHSWPACALPSRPGAMHLVTGALQNACASPNFAIDTLHDMGDATHPHGDLSREGKGVQKLVVVLPEEGDIVVIDAQKVLDRKPGSFDPCPLERRLKLTVDLPVSNEEPPAAAGADLCPPREPAQASLPSLTCPVRPPLQVAYPNRFKPKPTSVAAAGKRLYLSDEAAPVIHVVNVADPCSPVETPPLLPSSYDEPARPVFTSVLAASPLTHDKKQYLYAVDYKQGSAMVFDITEGMQSYHPIVREHPEFFPFSPRDRLALSAPVRDITFATRDPIADKNGTLQSGVLCNPVQPSPNVPVPRGVAYQTSSDFTQGAGPRALRGTFALAALTNGQIQIVDVDDLDAPCRRYNDTKNIDPPTTLLPEWVTGCGACTDKGVSNLLGASGEGTCRAVVRHEVRSASFTIDNPIVGSHYPTPQTFPILSLKGTTLRTDASSEGLSHPKLLGPAPPATNAVCDPRNSNNSTVWNLSRTGTNVALQACPNAADQNFVIPDVREPRSHIEQDWSLTYEGVVPGFDGKVARLQLSSADPTKRGVFDENANFCDHGVRDQRATELEAMRLSKAKGPMISGHCGAPAPSLAPTDADYVEITNPLPDPSDPYWGQVDQTGSCNFIRCQIAFGDADTPTQNRSFVIREAYQDRLLVDATPVSDATDRERDPKKRRTVAPECCFPTLVTYQVRGHHTWIATGSATGFAHHTIVDPNTGRCVEAGVDPNTGAYCDPVFATRTGRAYEEPPVPSGCLQAPLSYDDLRTFHNPQMYFAVYAGSMTSQRDMSFGWHMSGGFIGLQIGLGGGSSAVAPQSITYSNALGQALVTDASLQGISLVDLGTLAVVNSFF